MSICVAGIDPSLTSTGLSVAEGEVSAAWATSITSRGKRADSWARRTQRINDIAAATVDLVPPGALVVVEGPAYGHAMEPGFYDRAALMHRILTLLAKQNCPYGVAAPASVKRWVTGSGAASKKAVATGVRRYLPDLRPGSEDESDAAAMMLMAAQRCGLLASSVRTEVLETVEWQEL